MSEVKYNEFCAFDQIYDFKNYEPGRYAFIDSFCI